jgi:hypothetical protein
MVGKPTRVSANCFLGKKYSTAEPSDVIIAVVHSTGSIADPGELGMSR